MERTVCEECALDEVLRDTPATEDLQVEGTSATQCAGDVSEVDGAEIIVFRAEQHVDVRTLERRRTLEDAPAKIDATRNCVRAQRRHERVRLRREVGLLEGEGCEDPIDEGPPRGEPARRAGHATAQAATTSDSSAPPSK